MLRQKVLTSKVAYTSSMQLRTFSSYWLLPMHSYS